MKPLIVTDELIATAVELHLKSLSLIDDDDVVEGVWHDAKDRPTVYLKKD
jgi:hypothetical protein